MQLPLHARSMYKSWLILFVVVTSTQARVGPQLKDFLCGCEYCVTVPTQEPLDIGRHMIMCHSSRDATLKTLEIMRQMKQERLDLEKKASQLEQLDVIRSIQDSITSTYTWTTHEIYGSVYSDPSQLSRSVDRWIYTEDFKWVWSVADMENFLYSYDYGWLYVTKYQWFRVVYWYEKQTWTFPRLVE